MSMAENTMLNIVGAITSESGLTASFCHLFPIVGNPKSQKKNSVGIFEYILALILKVFLNM